MTDKMQINNYFFRLNATQGAIVIGIYEIVGLLQVYLGAWLYRGLVVDRILPAFDGTYYSGSSNGDVSHILPLGFTILLSFPTMMTVGALMGSRCLMQPWIVLAYARVGAGFLMFFLIFGLPFSSTAFYYFLALSLFNAASLYSLLTVKASYWKMANSVQWVTNANVPQVQRAAQAADSSNEQANAQERTQTLKIIAIQH